MPVGLCHMDLDFCILRLNPLFAQLCDLAMAEQLRVSPLEILPAEIARQLVPEFAYVARTGSSSGDVEVRGHFMRSGGREYTWISNTHPVRSGRGEMTGIITVLQDVTALADQRREIEAVRDRLDEAQRVSRVGSWEWNLLNDEVWWSQEMYEILGEDLSFEPTYAAFFEHVYPADRAKVRAQTERMLADSEPVRTTFRVHRGDGSERLIFGAGRLERTADGVASRIIGTWQDVTERSARPTARRRRARR